MGMKKRREARRRIAFAVFFTAVNLLAILLLYKREERAVNSSLSVHAQNTQQQFGEVMLEYERSFQLFVQMMAREIEHQPDPDDIWDYLKGVDAPLYRIEGETFDGLYMYYKGRYLYSWDTPYSVYEDSGYDARERSWYQAAVAGDGDIVFTPPYMSYANHYILTTISQLQPDGETVFAYDIKMGDIQELVSGRKQYEDEQTIIFDSNGTVIGSTDSRYLGGSLSMPLEDAADAVEAARTEMKEAKAASKEETAKAEDKYLAAFAFHSFRQQFDEGFAKLRSAGEKAVPITLDGTRYVGFLQKDEEYNFLILVPVYSILKATVSIWLVPLLLVEMLLLYVLGRVVKEQKNRELREAYIELGQTQRRLEIALSAAQKAAAIDDMTGMMNFKSFRKAMVDIIENMDQDEKGILIMLDGDHFKLVNDNYGHNIGDEVIKLSAQMIVGRIRTVDIASRLHGDEFAIFISNTADPAVAKRIVDDINKSIAKEAGKRKIPAITLSAGAVVVGKDDNYTSLSKDADDALYRAKETHDGGFAYMDGDQIKNV